MSSVAQAALKVSTIGLLALAILCFLLSSVFVYTLFVEQERMYARMAAKDSQRAFEEGVSAGCQAVQSIQAGKSPAISRVEWARRSQHVTSNSENYVSKEQ